MGILVIKMKITGLLSIYIKIVHLEIVQVIKYVSKHTV